MDVAEAQALVALVERQQGRSPRGDAPADNLEVEEMLVTFRGLDFRLTFCMRHEARLAWCDCEVKVAGVWKHRAALNMPENELKFGRGMEWLYAYADSADEDDSE